MNDSKNAWSQWLTTGLFVAAAFVIGMLFTEVRYLKSGAPRGAAGAGAVADAGDAAAVPTGSPEEARPVDDTDHIRGNVNAPITLIEYSDFECPYCATFHPTLSDVLAEYGDDVRVVYRHYPLSFHPNAQKAAEGSECVAKLGGNDAFWTYADTIFAEQEKLGNRLNPEAITTAATAAGVNMSEFQTCLDSGEMADRVQADMDNGSVAGVTGTPGTILVTEDGQAELISGALPLAQVKAVIDRYLE